MPIQVLRPNLVQDAEDAGDFTLYPSSASLVGTASTLWRDDDPATYAELTYNFTRTTGLTTPTRQDVARAPLDVLTVDSSTATLNSILIEITGEQVSTTAPPSVNGVGVFVDFVDSDTYDAGFGDYLTEWRTATIINNFRDGSDLYLPGEWSSFRHQDTGVELTASEVLDFFASGRVVVHGQAADSTTTNGTYSAVGRIFDVTVTIDYTLTTSPCNQELAGAVVDSTASVSNPAYVTLPAYRGPSVLDLTLGFTATSSDRDTITFAGIWGGWDGTGVDTDLAVTTDYPIVNDGLPHDYTHTFTVGEFGETLADIKAALSETGNAAVRFETSSGTITFSDVWVQVGHKCYVLAPPLRRYPPVNNGGFGPTRHHPRTVNRRVGGSY